MVRGSGGRIAEWHAGPQGELLGVLDRGCDWRYIWSEACEWRGDTFGWGGLGRDAGVESFLRDRGVHELQRSQPAAFPCPLSGPGGNRGDR